MILIELMLVTMDQVHLLMIMLKCCQLHVQAQMLLMDWMGYVVMTLLVLLLRVALNRLQVHVGSIKN
jgi:hypothetical protein